MRKYIRQMLRKRAENAGIKPSKFVHSRFVNMQVEKYGQKTREINMAKGTHPRRTWKNRILLGIEK